MLFPVIDMEETGRNINRLRNERGLSVADVQRYFGFDQPQAVYKWQRGETIPTVDNLYALSYLLNVPMKEILVPTKYRVYASHFSAHMRRSRR